ncbi:pepsinogen c [Pyrenophora seminiperda CCB06]|uniref:Pepsinogen c n=1 Tax=Pyrenophora seminiperda CCB06 TaxID=1302712 RepID=A0A3M7MIV2_9PLEO|nr:pepsinogen c [Pyrenophora seminiperda CCB06]
MVASMKTLLAVATTASAAVLELPVSFKNSYASVTFEVGTPSKEHRLLFDTGSASAFMTNTDCTETSCQDGSKPYYIRQPYNASASSSAVDLHIPAKIPYLGGNVAGGTFEDMFHIPGGSTKWNQTFLSVNESSWRFITADGFLGLGFSSIAQENTTTVVETMMQDGLLDAPCFSLFYGTNFTDDAPQDGVLTVGGTHEEEYVDGTVVYAPLRKENPYQLWRAPLRSVNILVAQNPSNPNSTVEIRHGRLPTTQLAPGTFPPSNTTWPMYGSGAAVFDTGAGRLSVPSDIIDALYYNLGWNNTKLMNREERMDCQHLNASWAITLTLGEGAPENDVSFSLRGDEFTYPGGQCMPPFDPSGTGGFVLVGTAFLHRYYSVFDFGSKKVENYAPRIGFGKLKKKYDWLHL